MFLLSYAFCWLGYWLWTLLIVEDEYPEFADITELGTMRCKRLRIRHRPAQLPVFLVLGRPEGQPETVLQAARPEL